MGWASCRLGPIVGARSASSWRWEAVSSAACRSGFGGSTSRGLVPQEVEHVVISEGRLRRGRRTHGRGFPVSPVRRRTPGCKGAEPGHYSPDSGHGDRSTSHLQDDVRELSHDRAARFEATRRRVQLHRHVGRQSRRRALRPAARQSRPDRRSPGPAHRLRCHDPAGHDEGSRRQPVNDAKELTIEVRGMTCDHCERSVAKALQTVPGVHQVLEVSHADARARVMAGVEATADRIERAVAKAGYRARVNEQSKRSEAPTVITKGGGDFDLLIVGRGSAGFAAAIKAADLGARVAMAEGATLGGTCVNVGCVPSKTLIRAAEAHHRRVHHGFRGIPATDGQPDWPTVRAEKDALVAELRQTKYWNVLRAYPSITLFQERATFTSSLEARLASGRTLTAGKIVVTTGSSPWAPPIPGLAEAGYRDNASAMALERLPQSLIVIGGSAVGLELAQMFARLGVRVTVLESLPRVVAAEDADIGNALADYLRSEGLDVYTDVRVDRVTRGSDGYEVQYHAGSASRTARADQLLVATGRRANTAGFGLDQIGVTLGKKGEIVVNEFLQTTNPNVYAAGDVIGDPMFVYVAAHAGALASENSLTGNERRYDLSALPKVTFTDPAVSSVGLTENEARAQGIEPLVSKLPLEHVPRAIAAHDTRGFIKLVADAGTKKIIGAHILAAEAGEMITEPTLAIKLGLTIEDLTSTFHPYLTLSEGIKLAAQAFTKDVAKLSCCAA